MLVAGVSHSASIFNLNRAPAGFMIRGFQVDGHAWFHRNIGCVGKKRVVHFFGGADQKRKLSRFQTDGMAEEKVRLIR
jgi:hypothetical protein